MLFRVLKWREQLMRGYAFSGVEGLTQPINLVVYASGDPKINMMSVMCCWQTKKQAVLKQGPFDFLWEQFTCFL